MTEKSIHGLSCPNCSGMLEIPEGQAVIVCPYCDMLSLVKGDRGIRRYQVQRTVGRDVAEKAMRQFLSGKIQVARNASKEARVQEAFLAYLPFWTSWVHVMGWAFGQEKVGSGDDERWEKITPTLTFSYNTPKQYLEDTALDSVLSYFTWSKGFKATSIYI